MVDGRPNGPDAEGKVAAVEQLVLIEEGRPQTHTIQHASYREKRVPVSPL